MPAGADVRRLHPWTLMQRFVVSLPGFVILLIPVVRSPSGSSWLNLGIALVYGAVTLPLIYLQYHRFRYWITPKELVIHSGVLTRRRRNIPIERIQNIEIERRLLPRLLGTASVKVFTAGSAAAEGALEYVSVSEANRIREVIRQFQRRMAESAPPSMGPAGDVERAAPDESRPGAPSQVFTGDLARVSTLAATENDAGEHLFSMSLERVLLSGMFRFSLLYIAIIFSFLQFIEPDPELLAEMLTRGRFRRWTVEITNSPWMAGSVAVLAAALLSWLSGIAVNLNKYYRFSLWQEKDKLHKKHGLLTLSEATIPLKKVQALICRSNPVMAYFGWWALELQTMGLNVREQGHRVAAPFGREEEIVPLTGRIFPVRWPVRLSRVSRLTIRRRSIRYGVLLVLASGLLALLWRPALLTLILLPLVPVWAWLQYRHHAYELTDDALVIRRGVIRRMLWYIPIEKMHVFYSAQSIFQRRLRLKTVYVDTAGASNLHFPTIVDLPSDVAEAMTGRMYDRFRELLSDPAIQSAPIHEGNRAPDRAPPVSSSALPVPEGR